jgi:hypothetical protein
MVTITKCAAITTQSYYSSVSGNHRLLGMDVHNNTSSGPDVDTRTTLSE